MTTMLERAARAAAVADATLHNGPDLYETNPDLYLRLTSAVLLAARGDQVDLNDGMGDVYRAGFEAMFDAKFKDEYPMMSCGWEAMINAILNEPPE